MSPLSFLAHPGSQTTSSSDVATLTSLSTESDSQSILNTKLDLTDIADVINEEL